MTVADVIEYVRYGELANFGIIKNLSSEYPAEVIDAEKAIISYINLGLIELYKRFNLRTEETVVIMSENLAIYTLNIPTLNSIVGVYDEEGSEYVLNSENDALSILTPSYNVIQVPNPSEGGALYVMYNASPDKIEWNDDLTTLTVPIPPVLYEPLFKYIGYRGCTGMTKDTQTDVQLYYNSFLKSCDIAIQLGVVPTEDPLVSGTKLELKGFV
ncbi:MAG: hypothetical protein WC179_06950 [Candidatus Cloacimonadaceae bacterium]